MNKTAQKIRASTQRFTEIEDIIGEVVLLWGGNACSIVEVKASNFALLSKEEQAAKISSYGSLLNSLSFPIQILIRNKRVDISSYLKFLDEEGQKTAILQNEKLKNYIKLYRDFVAEMTKVNIVLDKAFYIIIPYSHLERGAKGSLKKEDFLLSAKTALRTKADSLLSQLERLSLKARVLGKEELILLFYNLYNQEVSVSSQIETQEKVVVQPLK